ncbi:MAG: hypothetical protein KME47_11190 [Nodosilinea sp. WJT8-NPBG4]|jgi:gas vesicle protein|nr:hypothetical protein [Nodosilinea sp. WJT8-NPBG4]
MSTPNNETDTERNGNWVSSTAEDESDSFEQNVSPNSQAFTKVAIGALIGATLGGIAGALINKGVVDRINTSVRGVGNTVRKTTAGIDETIKGVGDAVQSVAVEVNATAREINEAVRETAEGISGTVQSTVHTVQSTADSVQETVGSTVNTVKSVVEETTASANLAPDTDQATLYKLVPVTGNKPNA